MWFKNHSKRAAPPEDVDEAVEMRNEAKASLENAQRKDSYVSGLASRLIERRDLNGFGDQIQITYTRRST
jgi:uncharacterized protein YggE